MRTIVSKLKRLILSDYFVFFLTVLYFCVTALFIPELRSRNNFSNILIYIWPLLILTVGQTVVLIVAGIDLSQTAVMSLSSAVGAALIAQSANAGVLDASPIWNVLINNNGGVLNGVMGATLVAILVMVIIGTLIGALNGLCVAVLKMPAFMVTLITQALFGAIAIWLLKSEKIPDLPESYIAIAGKIWGAISPMMVISLIVVWVLHQILSRSLLGRYVYSVGTNARASYVSGVPVNLTIIAAYAISGACAGLAGVFLTAVQESGSPTLGLEMLMDVIGAAVIGGVSLFGGKGKIIGAVFGVLFFITLDNTLNLLSLSFYTVMVVKGSVILIAAMLDIIRGQTMRSA